MKIKWRKHLVPFLFAFTLRGLVLWGMPDIVVPPGMPSKKRFASLAGRVGFSERVCLTFNKNALNYK